MYDHFLAKNWSRYSDVPLHDYVENFYDSLEAHYELLPLRIQKMMPYMLADNWLLSYASVEGISRVLEGMNRRTKNRSGMDKAVNELELFYSEFETEFKNLFEKHVQGDFDTFYKEAGDDKKYSKFLALNLIDIVSSAPKRQRNIFISSLINYAKSQSDISSVFIKAY